MKYFLVAFSLILFTHAYAQQYECSSDARFWELMKNDSEYRSQNELLEKALAQSNNQRAFGSSDTVVTIPIVVHVIHKGEAIGVGSNIADSQIHAAIRGVNDRFRGRLGFGEDIKIQFCLAKSDPNGNYTTGINRVEGSSVQNFDSLGMSIFNGGPAAKEHDVKDLSRWPTTDYYNIWTVWNISGPTGFAYLPTTSVDPYDGSVITASGFVYENSITTHELGHAFNLFHVWETNYTTCQSSTNCSKVDDRICDTPPHINKGSGDCTDVYPCNTSYDWDNTRYNYLGKCGSQDRFTPDQKDRMRASLSLTVRDSLLHSIGCHPQHNDDLGIIDMESCGDSISAIVKNFGANTIIRFSIGWTIDGKTQTVYNWKGSLTSEALDTVVLGSNTLSSTAGAGLKIWTTKPNGNTDTIYQNDTFIHANTYLPLPKGNYTIGGANPDYKTIQNAVSELNNRGICGPVVFNIRKGVYTEQFILNDVDGSSQTNTVTFQSEGEDAGLVEITYAQTSSSNNFIFRLNGARHVRLRHLTFTSKGSTYFSNAIQQVNNTSSNLIEHCIFNGNGATWSSTSSTAILYFKNTIDSSMVIRNNIFNNGSHAVHVTGSIKLGPGAVVDSNRFNNQTYTALYINNQNHPRISNNVFTSQYNQQFAIVLENCEKEVFVLNNQIYGKMKGGIKLNGCRSSINHRSIVANNFIQVDGTRINEGLQIRDSDHQLVAHNSVYLKAADTLSKSLNCYRSYAVEIRNNILSNFGGGYAIYLDRLDSKGLIMDHNDLFSTGPVGFYTTRLTGLTQWQSQTGFDKNSVAVNPNFQSDSFLFPCQPLLNGAGNYLSQVSTDFLGKKRDKTNPDMGALEFNLGVLDLGKDTSGCDSLIIDALIPNAKYIWSNGDTTRTTVATKTGLYWVKASNNCGTWGDTIHLTILEKPSLTIEAEEPSCDSVHLKATSDNSVLWNTGDTSKTISVQKSGYYKITASNACGVFTDSVMASVLHKPSLMLEAGSPSCDSVSLKATTSSDTLRWNTGDASTAVYVKKSGYYTATTVNSCGVVIDSIFATIWPMPSLSLGADTGACDRYIIIPPPNDYKLLWNTGDTSEKLVVSTSGSYTTQLTNSYGCKAMSDTVQVEIHESPTVFIGNDTTLSCNDSIELKTRKAYAEYEWSDGSTGDRLIVHTNNIDTAQTVFVLVVDMNGCRGSDTVKVSCEKVNYIGNTIRFNSILMYPNPVEDFITIESDGESETVSVVIYDYTGKAVVTATARQPSGKVSVKALSPGIYTIKISDYDRGTFKGNFIKL